MKQYEGTRTQVEGFAALADKLLDLPRKGRHVGGGRHVTIPDTPGIGWTLEHQPEEHPTRPNLFAVRLHSELSDAIDDTELGKRLTGPERASMRAAKQSAPNRDESWRRP